MAAKARARVKAIYDWKYIIPAYEDLWADLAARRAAAPPPRTHFPSLLPTLPDPYAMYATYPTAVWRDSDAVTLVLPMEGIKTLWQHDLNTYAHDVLLSADKIAGLVRVLGHSQTVRISDLLQQFQLVDQPALWRTLGWLCKLGMIRKINLALAS
jgi:hypothetical protein